MGLRKTRYPLYRKLHVPQGRYRQVGKFSPSTRTRSLDHLDHSQSQYRLSYSSPQNNKKVINIIIKIYEGLLIMFLARYILGLQEEDAKPSM